MCWTFIHRAHGKHFVYIISVLTTFLWEGLVLSLFYNRKWRCRGVKFPKSLRHKFVSKVWSFIHRELSQFTQFIFSLISVNHSLKITFLFILPYICFKSRRSSILLIGGMVVKWLCFRKQGSHRENNLGSSDYQHIRLIRQKKNQVRNVFFCLLAFNFPKSTTIRAFSVFSSAFIYLCNIKFDTRMSRLPLVTVLT